MAATDDAHLVQEALRMALKRRHPQAELLHHSDQGSAYTSDAYLAVLKSWGIQLSMSRTGKGSRQCSDGAILRYPEARMSHAF
jgi:transposase InsO family protein